MKYLPIILIVVVAFLSGFAVKGRNLNISRYPIPISTITPSTTPTMTNTPSPIPLTNTPIPQPTKIVQKSKCTEEKTNAFRALAKTYGYSDDLIETYVKAMIARNCEPLPPESQPQIKDSGKTTRCTPDYGGGFTCYSN